MTAEIVAAADLLRGSAQRWRCVSGRHASSTSRRRQRCIGFQTFYVPTVAWSTGRRE